MTTTLIAGVTVTSTDTEVSYTSGLAIDFDGCGCAYAPPGFGAPLDFLANAGKNGDWWGVVTDTGDPDGNPIIQGPNDPYPGYYVATSALNNPAYPRTDPRRYIDGTQFPFTSIPIALMSLGVRVGDLLVVERLGVVVPSFIADDGGKGIGEGSPKLAAELGVPNGRHGGCGSGVTYRIFLRSRNSPAWPRPTWAADALALANSSPATS